MKFHEFVTEILHELSIGVKQRLNQLCNTLTQNTLQYEGDINCVYLNKGDIINKTMLCHSSLKQKVKKKLKGQKSLSL